MYFYDIIKIKYFKIKEGKENEKKFYDNWPLEIGEKLKIGDKPSIKRKADGNPKSKIFSILFSDR